MDEHQRGKHTNAGFTLVELLVVIVILGVLSAIVVFAVGNISNSAASTSCKTDVRTVASGLEVWHAQTGSYPSLGTTGQAEMTTNPGAVLRSWPNSPKYTITLDATVPGQINVASPGGSATPVVSGQPSPCDGLSGAVAASSSSTSTSTASTTTTTAAPASNGVTATPSVSGSTNPWYGDNELVVANSSPMTALSITIKIKLTPGVSYNSQFTTFWGGITTSGHSTTATTLDYTFTLNSGQTIVPGSWTVAAQFNGTGTPRVTSGDTWTVTSTSSGVTSTLNGTF
jgi:prepilin-type N-terminal cleavage/methylation domain-containing protein